MTEIQVHPKAVLAGALTGALALGITVALVGSLESWINQDLAVPHAQTGLAQSALYAGNLLGSLVAGWLMGKLSPRRFGLFSLMAMMAGSAVSAGRTYEWIVAGRLLTGFGYAGAIIFFNAAIVRAYPRRQAVYLNLYHATFAASAALTLLAARPVVTALGGWTAGFWIAGAACLAPLAIFTAIRIPAVADSEPFSWRQLWRVVRRPAIAATLIVMVLYTMSEQSMTVFLASFAQGEAGLAAAAAAQAAALFWVGVLAGRLCSAALSRRLAEPPQLVISLAGMAIAALAGLAARQPELIYGATFLVGLCAGPAVPLMFSYATRGTAQLKGAVLAMCNLANCVGGVLGPALIGAIGDRVSLEAGLSAAAALLLIGLAPYAVILRRDAA